MIITKPPCCPEGKIISSSGKKFRKKKSNVFILKLRISFNTQRWPGCYFMATKSFERPPVCYTISQWALNWLPLSASNNYWHWLNEVGSNLISGAVQWVSVQACRGWLMWSLWGGTTWLLTPQSCVFRTVLELKNEELCSILWRWHSVKYLSPQIL